MNFSELLPIGSVVRLKTGTKRLMIFGVGQTKLDTNTTYDYISVIYPEGNVGPEGQFLFNHEDIEEVVFKGYDDEERTAFVHRLQEVLNAE